ncbi:MAG: hypothetical protein ACREUF_14950 [Solimonas sp.]
MRRLTILGSTILVAALWLASSLPTFSADTGTVNVTVSAQAQACLVVGSTIINYGTKPFSAGTLITSPGNISAIDSCAPVAQNLQARGTDATGTAGAWTLVNGTGGCGAGLNVNQFRHEISSLSSGQVKLTTSNQSVGTLAAGATGASLDTHLTMPCAGSVGAGQAMSTQIVLTAFVP